MIKNRKRYLRPSPGKLPLNCSVAMLALLIRFLKETHSCEDVDVSHMTRFFAAHFQSLRRTEISADSLRGKYDKPMPGQLEMFRKWMNEGLKLVKEWEERLYGKSS